jgi:hypothetical protein
MAVPDSARETDERRMGSEHVASPELNVRLVENGIPT